jgi:hypothetical protein
MGKPYLKIAFQREVKIKKHQWKESQMTYYIW